MFDEIRKSTTGAFDKAKLLLNPNASTTAANTTTTNGNAVAMTDDSETESQQQPDRLEELSEFCPQLTYQQRIIGFIVSFSLGCTFVASTHRWYDVFHRSHEQISNPFSFFVSRESY